MDKKIRMIQFTEVEDVRQKEFEEAVSIYAESIPAAERHPIAMIEERVAKKKERMFVGRFNKETVFMALIWPLQGTDFTLFDYMAVKKAYRNRGIGTEFVKNIFRICGIENKRARFILEVEDPLYGDNRNMRKRRVAFYKRNGAKQMENVGYILPPLSGDFSTRMTIMVLSPCTVTRLSGKLVKALFVQIYRELYCRGEDDPLLNSFIDLIPSTVKLL